MRAVRTVLLVLIGIAAVAVTFLLAPKSPIVVTSSPVSGNYSDSATTFGSAIDQAIANGELNNNTAQGAPQQAVVNGWTARDLLAVIGRQMDQQNTLTADNVKALGGISSQLKANSVAEVQALNEISQSTSDKRPTLLLMLAVLALVVIGTTMQMTPQQVVTPTALQPGVHSGVPSSPTAPALASPYPPQM
jgi:hypothetical protein